MNCTICKAPFSGPYQLGKHRLAEHPAEVRKAKAAKKRVTPPPPVPERDGELLMIEALMGVVEAASLDVDAIARTFTYVAERFGVSLVLAAPVGEP